MNGHDWPRILFPTCRYMGTDASGDRVTTDRSLPFPGAKQAESIVARQPSILCIRVFFYYCLFYISNQHLILVLVGSSRQTVARKGGGDMVNVPLKKKIWQVSSPGRVTPAPKL